MSDLKDFVIRNGVLKKYTGNSANVVIPDGVTSIGKEAFSCCKSIESVVIPEGVISIGDDAFWLCSKLKTVFIPDSLLKLSKSGAFWHCSDLDTIVSNSKEAFNRVWNVLDNETRERVLLKAASEKNDTAWIIAKIKLNKNNLIARAIEQENVAALDRILSFFKKPTIDELDEWISAAGGFAESSAFLLAYKKSLYSYKKIEAAAERHNEIELGTKKRSVAEWKKIFDFTKSDEGITITKCKIDEPCVTIPNTIGKTPIISLEGAFMRCERLEIVEIPETVKKIGKNTFCDCKLLKNVVLPKKVLIIDDGAFEDCIKLESITISERVTRIGNNAFRGCKSLESIDVPKSVASIGDYAFYFCAALKNITIPEGVKSIGYGAFVGCTSLESITISKRLVYNSNNLFKFCNKLADDNGFVVLEGVLCSYFGQEKDVVIASGIERIGNYSFSCRNTVGAGDSIKSVVFPGSIASIGDFAFSFCAALKNIVIPEGTKSIGYGAFEGCKSLETIDIPASITSIGHLAFMLDESLTIHAPAGSYAEQYAKENNIPFVAV